MLEPLLARTEPNEIPYLFGQMAQLLTEANVTSLECFTWSEAEQKVADLRETLEEYRRHKDQVLAGPEQSEWVRSVFLATKTSCWTENLNTGAAPFQLGGRRGADAPAWAAGGDRTVGLGSGKYQRGWRLG